MYILYYCVHSAREREINSAQVTSSWRQVRDDKFVTTGFEFVWCVYTHSQDIVTLCLCLVCVCVCVCVYVSSDVCRHIAKTQSTQCDRKRDGHKFVTTRWSFVIWCAYEYQSTDSASAQCDRKRDGHKFVTTSSWIIIWWVYEYQTTDSASAQCKTARRSAQVGGRGCACEQAWRLVVLGLDLFWSLSVSLSLYLTVSLSLCFFVCQLV